MTPKIFTGIIIALSLGAAVAYTISGDWRRAVYWFAAAVIGVVVTY